MLYWKMLGMTARWTLGRMLPEWPAILSCVRINSPVGLVPTNALARSVALLTTSRLLVTNLDRDMEFVWTLKHLDKTSWQGSSSVQIKPQPKLVFVSAASRRP